MKDRASPESSSGDTGSLPQNGITIGCRNDLGDHFWQGTISEVIFINNDIQEQEIFDSDINLQYRLY